MLLQFRIYYKLTSSIVSKSVMYVYFKCYNLFFFYSMMVFEAQLALVLLSVVVLLSIVVALFGCVCGCRKTVPK